MYTRDRAPLCVAIRSCLPPCAHPRVLSPALRERHIGLRLIVPSKPGSKAPFRVPDVEAPGVSFSTTRALLVEQLSVTVDSVRPALSLATEAWWMSFHSRRFTDNRVLNDSEFTVTGNSVSNAVEVQVCCACLLPWCMLSQALLSCLVCFHSASVVGVGLQSETS